MFWLDNAGEISSNQSDRVNFFTWNVLNLFAQYETIDSRIVSSPLFDDKFRVGKWQLALILNGGRGSEGYIGCFLGLKKCFGAMSCINVQLIVLDGDGKVYTKCDGWTDSDGRFGKWNFLHLRTMVEKKQEISPTGVLTLLCVMDPKVVQCSAVATPISGRIERKWRCIFCTSTTPVDVFKCVHCRFPKFVACRHLVNDSTNTSTETNTKDETKKQDKVISKDERSKEDETISEDELSSGEEDNGIKILSDNLKQALLDGRMSDAVLKVDGREFKVHKVILVSRSSVFASMFEHDMAEKKHNVVDIPDCIAESFEVFLHYLYSGSVETLSVSNVYNVYYAADKYQVKDLKKKCVKFMIDNISVETFCDVIVLALNHGESKLKITAVDFFSRNIKKIIKTVQWQKYLDQNSTQANELLIKALDA